MNLVFACMFAQVCQSARVPVIVCVSMYVSVCIYINSGFGDLLEKTVV